MERARRSSAAPGGAQSVSAGATGLRDQALLLLAINALYVGFGVMGGIIVGGLPPILRAQGLGVASAGWFYALYLPFGLTFLWAAIVDRVSLPFLTRRVAWIVTMQCVTIAFILLIAVGHDWPLALLVALAFAAIFAVATMDIALDALAVDGVVHTWRPIAAALKLAALSLGAMIGGGAFVLVFTHFGWFATFVLVAVLLAALTLPVLFAGRWDGNRPHLHDPGLSSKAPSLRHLLRSAGARRRIGLLTLVCCVIFPLAGLNRIMLVDVGVPLDRIAWIVGTLGPLSMLAVSAVSIPLMLRLGLRNAILVFALLCIGALVAMAWGFSTSVAVAAIVGTVTIGAGVSGIYTVLVAKILGWSVGSQPATNYAAYYGISRFASTLATIGAAQLISLISWTSFYAAGVVVLAGVVGLLSMTLMKETDGVER